MNPKGVDAVLVEKHFDSLAQTYDRSKKEKTSYYYQSLIKIVRSAVPPGKRVLDIGTGTGEILNAVRPSEGTGIDLSGGMIEQAEAKFKHLRFIHGSYGNFRPERPFDFVLLVDVIEHLESPEKLFRELARFCDADTEIVLTMANPAWEPLLHLLEKLNLKMQEGPHHRISQKALLQYATDAGFLLRSMDKFILLPVGIPLLSRFFNEWVAKLPLISDLALIERWVFKKSSYGQ